MSGRVSPCAECGEYSGYALRCGSCDKSAPTPEQWKSRALAAEAALHQERAKVKALRAELAKVKP